jgi:predicted RNA-binding protein with RPS1 domain
MTWVKVTEVDDRGRVNLSRKEALKEREGQGLTD